MSFTINRFGALNYMTAPNIAVPHAFTTRRGGVSEGVYLSLNLGLNRGDEQERVKENYAVICRELEIEPDDIVCSKQVHGTRIRVVTSEDRGKLFVPEPEEADALITGDADVALAVFTADCVPILLYDPVRGAVGAVHAGWRGTVADIACKSVKQMADALDCRTADIRAAIGPCISKCCFETGPEVADALLEALGTAAESCISQAGDKFMVDLKAANRLLLIRAGIRDDYIEISDECTFCEHNKYWSHRRTDGTRGSQAAIITLKGNAPR